MFVEALRGGGRNSPFGAGGFRPNPTLSGGLASTGLSQLWSISTVGGGVFFLGGGGALRSGDAGDCADGFGLATAYGSRISRTSVLGGAGRSMSGSRSSDCV